LQSSFFMLKRRAAWLLLLAYFLVSAWVLLVTIPGELEQGTANRTTFQDRPFGTAIAMANAWLPDGSRSLFISDITESDVGFKLAYRIYPKLTYRIDGVQRGDSRLSERGITRVVRICIRDAENPDLQVSVLPVSEEEGYGC